MKNYNPVGGSKEELIKQIEALTERIVLLEFKNTIQEYK